MVELVAAVALAPWAQPLRFQPLPGWQTGASGTHNSSYGPVPDIGFAEGVDGLDDKEASAIVIRRPRILLRRLS